MFTSIEIIPQQELEARHQRLRKILATYYPDLDGIMVFSRSNIYYLTGTFAIGLLWFPLEGKPVLAVRKGMERAALEAPSTTCINYKSYSKVAALLEEAGSPLSKNFGVEEKALSWSLGKNFSKNFSDYNFKAADAALDRARSVKTPWELEKVRAAGARHYKCMVQEFPKHLHLGISGAEASRVLWNIFAQHENTGGTRMSELGQEVVLGHVSIDLNASYPSYYNGPLGVKGLHPTAAYMGYAKEFWNKRSILAIDVGFVYEGYNSDKTQLYFAGKESDIPDWARRAQDCCLEIQARIAAELKPGGIPQELYQQSLDIAAKAGYAEGFMGYAGNKVPFLGHSLGLQVDEWPVIANKFNDPLEENMVLALEPKITLPGKGMVGVENTFIVSAGGGEAVSAGSADLTVDAGNILCIDG